MVTHLTESPLFERLSNEALATDPLTLALTLALALTLTLTLTLTSWAARGASPYP